LPFCHARKWETQLQSDILKFLSDNIGKLEPFDYLLIAVAVLLVGVGVYTLLKSIYQQVIKAQEHLIALKDKTIEQHEKTINSLTVTKESLEKQYRNVEQELEEIRSKLQTQSKEHNKLVDKLVGKLSVLVRCVVLARLGLLTLNILYSYRVMVSYQTPLTPIFKERSMKVPMETGDAIDELSEKVFDKLELLDVFNKDQEILQLPTKVPEDAVEFLITEVRQSQLSIKKEIYAGNQIIEEHIKAIGLKAKG